MSHSTAAAVQNNITRATSEEGALKAPPSPREGRRAKGARIFFLSLISLFGFSALATAAENPPSPREGRGAGGEVLREIAFNIPAQPLAEALAEYSRQTDVIIIAPTELTTGKTSTPLNTTTDPHTALQRLLNNTNLTYQEQNGSIIITGPKKIRVSRLQEEDKKTKDSSSTDEESTTENSEVVVTGSRLKRNADEGPTPVTIFSRDHIDRTGVTNVADVLNYLPQQSFAMGEQTSGVGATRRANLRGLPAGATLVLINGRRTITSALLGVQNGFDLNTIPLAAVDRVEVLSGSASAVYGADAVGGVLNVVLKDAIDRPTMDIYYGGADEGAEERRASVGLGHAWNRGHLSVVLDFFSRDFLMGADRDLLANKDFRRFGSTDFRVATANPGNVSSNTGANLPGLSSPFAAVPVGSSGVGLTPASFSATAGQRNLESIQRLQSAVPESKRQSGWLFGDLELSDTTAFFGEFLYSHRDDTRLLTPITLSNALVPATNAFNPFGQAVRVNYLFEGIGSRRDEATSEFYRAAAGLRGSFSTWDWEVSALGLRDNGNDRTINRTNAAAVAAALASSDVTQALNVFQDGPGGSPALLASLVAPPIVDFYESEARQVSGFIRGNLFALPAGNVQLVVGGETRRENLDLNIRSGGIAIAPDRKTTSAYMESRIPIVSDNARLVAARSIDLTVAGRSDHYSDFGDTFNYQIGLEWKLLRSVLVRGAYGTSFRAPSLFELYSPSTPFPSVIADPRRNNQPSPYSQFFGGNPTVEPEEAKSWSAGFVFIPNETDSWRAEVTYWNIDQTQTIQAVDVNAILANETLFPGRVIRAAPTPADVAAGLPGVLVSIDQTYANFGELKTDGIDLSLSTWIEVAGGRLTPSLVATWVNNFTIAAVPGAPPTEFVDVARGLTGTIPKYRSTLGLDYERNRIALSTALRYTPSYADADFAGVRNNRTVGSQAFVDLQFRVLLSELFHSDNSVFDGLTVRAGATNVLDTKPKFTTSTGPIGYDGTQADLRQRFIYAGVSKVF